MPCGGSWRLLIQTSNPSTERFIADFQYSFGQQILDVTIAQGEPKIEPDGMPDDVGREAVTRA